MSQGPATEDWWAAEVKRERQDWEEAKKEPHAGAEAVCAICWAGDGDPRCQGCGCSVGFPGCQCSTGPTMGPCTGHRVSVEVTDLLVRTGDPALLDQTLQQLGPAVVMGGGTPGGYVQVEGCWVVRVYGDPGFIRWAIERQGYGEIVREVDEFL